MMTMASTLRWFVSLLPARRPEEKNDAMSSKMVRRSVNLEDLPSLAVEQKAELAALARRTYGEIDISDSPELTEKFWLNALRNPLYRPTKTSTTVRIDSHVLLWLRSEGKGYQSRINAILRREMIEGLKRKRRALSGAP
jgi:uncharacterized protein (DUF4415 family)